jgi:phage shock protein A
MGILTRATAIIKAKISKLLDRVEDPRETLDYSYQRQLELLQDVKRGIADVTTAKKRLELQGDKLKVKVKKYEQQAKDAVKAGRDDLATLALTRKQESLAQLESVESQAEQLQGEQDKLVAAEQRLSIKVESFRTRKETIKAQYTAAEAQVKISEATSGISEEMSDVGNAIQRAEDKTDDMKARAAAMDELIDIGALDNIWDDQDSIDRELSQISKDANVQAELAQLKSEAGKLGGAHLDKINDLDNDAVSALEKENAKLFYKKYGELVKYIRDSGNKVPDQDIIESDFILPPADVTPEEALLFFEGEGVVPG